MKRYEMIQKSARWYPTATLCRVYNVARSAYYAWLKRLPTKRETRDAILTIQIKTAYHRSKKRYGSPRIRESLRRDGVIVSKKKVAAIMRVNGLFARNKRGFRCSTDSRYTESIAPNLLARDFTAEAPNQVWVTDVTELPTRFCAVFLAVILDLYSRRVVGWALSGSNNTTLACSALDRALQARNASPGLLHHSDRGSPYGSKDYVAALKAAGIERSMSRTGDCWDNAVSESFFSTLEYECIQGRVFVDISDVRSTLCEYIDDFYNTWRLHSTVGYLSPIECEIAFASRRSAA